MGELQGIGGEAMRAATWREERCPVSGGTLLSGGCKASGRAVGCDEGGLGGAHGPLQIGCSRAMFLGLAISFGSRGQSQRPCPWRPGDLGGSPLQGPCGWHMGP